MQPSTRAKREPARQVLLCGALLTVGIASSCSHGGGGGGTTTANAGEELQKPGGGGSFFVDPNQSGRANRIRIAEMFWGRLVDIHDVDASGKTNVSPVFSDFVINENVQTDGTNYLLETNPITEKTRLVILRTKGAMAVGGKTFDDLLRQAEQGLPPITPKNDDGTDAGPFSFLSRNACLVVRFDDCLDDDSTAARNLVDDVRVLTGYPPSIPFSPRIVFDPNHGAIAGNRFHSTRLLIDMTVSEADSSSMSVALPVNSLGLPASFTTTTQPNVSLRIPSRLDFGAGQFTILTNLSGAPLATSNNGPVDTGSPTLEVVRAMRSGNPEDLNNGFLLDLNAPEILGSWTLVIENVADDPAGDPGLDFVVDLRFDTVCREAPAVGDILSVNNQFLEVTAPGGQPDNQGSAPTIRVRSLSGTPIQSPSSLLGSALFLSTYEPTSNVDNGCWVGFTPRPNQFPSAEVSTSAQLSVRFSEPMDPDSVTSFDSFLLVRGDSSTQPVPASVVVGDVVPSPDLKEFSFAPLLPFAHSQGDSTAYHAEIRGPTDLAGNALKFPLPFVDFLVDPGATTVRNGGIVMRFNSPDELPPLGLTDLRGQFFFDLDRGIIKPRPVAYSGVPADRINPVPSIMIPFPPGVQTPLSPLGSKLQTVWRYADLGWQVRDETKYNVDVIGLNWAPIGGQVLNDFYEDFEIRLSHSRKQPDEDIDGNLLPKWQNSGLEDRPRPFTDNVLDTPRSPQKIVHPRNLGYLVNPANRFIGVAGTLLMPFPMNKVGAPVRTFTWRDTADLSKAAGNGAGIPLDIEVGSPLFLDPGPFGGVASSGQVPTFGLPLLMEYRCYPSDSGVGLNAFDISLAINSSARPNFRAFSTGGVNTANTPITKNPDLELVPSGGFNPGSSPPGKKTKNSADNSFYIGQVDIVIRVSRLHTIWLDTLMSAPSFLTPILNPSPASQPSGTQVVIEYRGALGFVGAGTAPFDGQALDAYGDVTMGSVNFLNGNQDWVSDIRDVDGARYVQARISFINNIQTGLNAELSAIGIAFQE